MTRVATGHQGVSSRGSSLAVQALAPHDGIDLLLPELQLTRPKETANLTFVHELHKSLTSEKGILLLEHGQSLVKGVKL